MRELNWTDWAAVTARLSPLNAATMGPVDGAFIRSPAYW